MFVVLFLHLCRLLPVWAIVPGRVGTPSRSEKVRFAPRFLPGSRGLFLVQFAHAFLTLPFVMEERPRSLLVGGPRLR